jgi:hypothetical protein
VCRFFLVRQWMVGFHERWKISSPDEQLKKSVYNVSYIKRNIEISFRNVMNLHFRIIRSYFFKTILVLSSHLVDLHVKCSLFSPDLNKIWRVLSFRNLLGVIGRPVLKTDNLTICEPIVWRKCGNLDVSQRYAPPWPFTGTALPFFISGLLDPEDEGRYVPPKRRLTFSGLHSVISHHHRCENKSYNPRIYFHKNSFSGSQIVSYVLSGGGWSYAENLTGNPQGSECA